MSIPSGFRLIPKQPTTTMLETMAFNLSAEFGSEFTLEHKDFALAVYTEAWTLGIKPALDVSPAQDIRAAAMEEGFRKGLEAAAKVCDDLETKTNRPSRCAAAIRALSGSGDGDQRKFRLGDRVTKNKGSSWTGHVVGFYSTALTPVGYAVESEAETGSVQIYPETALSAAPTTGGDNG